MKKLYLIFGLLLLVSFSALAQKLTGAQILRSARSIYDQGRLHELPALLENALTAGDFKTDAEKVEAYKILIITFIYIEEPEKADDAMIKLLETEHFFRPNASDPLEFQNLFKKFRSDAVFRAGFRGGVSQTFINVIKNHYIFAESVGLGEYKSNLGIQVFGTFEKDFKKQFVLVGELGYVSQSYNYSNPKVYISDFPGQTAREASVSNNTTHARIQLNALMQYKLTKDKDKKFTPYVFAGPSVGYLMSSTFDGTHTVENRDNVSTSIDNTNRFKPLNISAIAGAGFRFRMGELYVVGDLRYQYGFSNVVDPDNQYDPSRDNANANNRNGYVDNEFSMHQAMVNLGVVIPYFKPKKLIK